MQLSSRNDQRRVNGRIVGLAIVVSMAALSCDLWVQPAQASGAACAGQRQSPLDLGAAHPVQGPPLQLDYTPFAANISIGEHSLEIAPAGGSQPNRLQLGAGRFDFVQLHFHHPSEHALEGRRWPMEVHLVHRAADGTLAVLGVMLRPGRQNDGLATLLDALAQDGGAKSPKAPFDLRAFLPASAAHYSYEGSLTTPPCSEIVSWIVFRDPVEAGIGQIAALAAAFPANARPLQPAGDRRIGLDFF